MFPNPLRCWLEEAIVTALRSPSPRYFLCESPNRLLKL